MRTRAWIESKLSIEIKLKGKGGSGEDESYRYSVPVKNDARRMSYVVYVLTKELGRERGRRVEETQFFDLSSFARFSDSVSYRRLCHSKALYMTNYSSPFINIRS